MRRLDRQWRTNVKDKESDISFQSKSEYEDKHNQGKGVRCHECEGFCYIKVECHTSLNKHKKGLSITWSDSDDESERETANSVMAFIEKYEYEGDYSDKNMTEEEMAATFRLLHSKWKNACLIGENQKNTINVLLQEKDKLLSTIIGMEEEVKLLNFKLQILIKPEYMLNNGPNMFDVMTGHMKVVGFDYSSMNKKVKIPFKKFVAPEKKFEF